MAKKKVSKEETIDEIIENSVHSEWCIVDTENEFSFMGNRFKISDSVASYMVLNKPKKNENGEWNNWSNDASNVAILVVDNGDQLRFFSESFTEVDSLKINIV